MKPFSISICILLFAILAAAQAPSEASAEFRSISGRFGVRLPETYSDYKPAVPLEISRKNFYFSVYKWNLSSGQFSISYASGSIDFEARAQAGLLLSGLREQVVGHLENGSSIVREREISLDRHPGIELVTQSRENETIAQLFVVKNRLYFLTMSLNTSQRVNPQSAINAFNSFRLLPQQILSEELEKFTDKLAPDALPQEPFVTRPTTDAQDEGLRGKVKRVTAELESYDGEDLSGIRHIAAQLEFNERGYLTREMDYDAAGLTHMVIVYGYLKGERAARMARKLLGQILVTKKPSAKDYVPPESDRLLQSLRFEYKYDKDGRLREKRMVFSDNGIKYEGETHDLKNKSVNRYGGNLLEHMEEGSYPIIYLLDDNGIPTERQSAILRRYTEVINAAFIYRYTYEFDTQGNWIKRTSMKTTQTNGKWTTVPFNVIYREIVYF